MVVEITPIGIDSIGWRFYIIWTVFNFSFVPIVYYLYPETAGRSLEDIDRFFMSNQSIFVHNDPDAKSSRRPERYIVQEREEVNRISHNVPANVPADVPANVQAAKEDEETGWKPGHDHVEKTEP